MTRVEAIKARKRAAELEVQMRALEIQKTEVLKGAPLESSLESSLKGHMDLAHDADATALVTEAYKELYSLTEEETLYPDGEDSCDLEFWDHGIVIPDSTAVLKELDAHIEKATVKKPVPEYIASVKTLIGDYQDAFRALDIKFAKRAIYLHDFRIVYAKLRAKMKISSVSVKAVVVKAAAAVKASASPSKAKHCGCVKSKCTSSSCGCSMRGEACDDSCGCGGQGSCCNAYTPGADDALVKERARAAVALKEKAARATKDKAERIKINDEQFAQLMNLDM